MEYITVQTKNVRKDVKEKAELAAKEAGFSSLQDILRITIINLAKKNVEISFGLSIKEKEELKKSIKDYKEGRFITYNPNQKLSEQLKRLGSV